MLLRKNKTGLVYNHIFVVEDAPYFCPIARCLSAHGYTMTHLLPGPSTSKQPPSGAGILTVPSNVFYLYLLPLLTRCARAGWAGRELVRICMGRDEAWLLLHTEGQGLHYSQPSN